MTMIQTLPLALVLSFLAPSFAAFAQDGAAVRPKAFVFREYGPPLEVMHLEDVDKPVPAENQVLIKVRASAANPADWHLIRGVPYLIRLDRGFFAPKTPHLGIDVAGVIEVVGANVTKFKPGDEVYGVARGAFGEYAIANEHRIALKPADMSFVEAAAVPVAAVTALQGLRDKGQLQPGQKVLINGASGGVGTYAVQIAKALGAEVTGVSSTRNLELVRSLGADHVIDYTREDFSQGSARYDLVLDNVGNRSLSDIRSVLTPNGIHVLVGGGWLDSDQWIGPFAGIIGGMVASKFTDKRFEFFVAEVTPNALDELTKLVGAKKLRSVIDRTYTLAETPAAIAYLEEARARGKVSIVVTPE